MKKPLLWLLAAFVLFTSFTTGPVTDYLNVPGPIVFNGQSYHLAWSDKPSKTYYKQEYIPKGQTLQKFNHMLLLELITGDFTVQDVVSAQMKQLENRKATDKLVQYEAIENPETGEIILDFVISNGPARAPEIAEWNAYRYKPYKSASGRKGVLLFATSTRAYGAKINGFLKDLETNRIPQIHAIGGYPFPEVKLKK